MTHPGFIWPECWPWSHDKSRVYLTRGLTMESWHIKGLFDPSANHGVMTHPGFTWMECWPWSPDTSRVYLTRMLTMESWHIQGLFDPNADHRVMTYPGFISPECWPWSHDTSRVYLDGVLTIESWHIQGLFHRSADHGGVMTHPGFIWPSAHHGVMTHPGFTWMECWPWSHDTSRVYLTRMLTMESWHIQGLFDPSAHHRVMTHPGFIWPECSPSSHDTSRVYLTQVSTMESWHIQGLFDQNADHGVMTHPGFICPQGQPWSHDTSRVYLTGVPTMESWHIQGLFDPSAHHGVMTHPGYPWMDCWPPNSMTSLVVWLFEVGGHTRGICWTGSNRFMGVSECRVQLVSPPSQCFPQPWCCSCCQRVSWKWPCPWKLTLSVFLSVAGVGVIWCSHHVYRVTVMIRYTCSNRVCGNSFPMLWFCGYFGLQWFPIYFVVRFWVWHRTGKNPQLSHLTTVTFNHCHIQPLSQCTTVATNHCQSQSTIFTTNHFHIQPLSCCHNP